MHLIKPSVLALSSRPIEYRGRFGLCLSAALHVPMAQAPQGTLWGEQSMWNFLAEAMTIPLIDECVAKLVPEFLVHGRAFAPPDSPGRCAVRVGLGAVHKRLLVSGERAWTGAGQVSAAQAFPEGMPLDWTRAYGGADFPANPVGRGRLAQEPGAQVLPNIEYLDDPLLDPRRPVRPAGLGALDVLSLQRAQFRGTYDENYLKQHAPGYPPDLDWRHFNLAPQDQWLPQPLAGDEPFVLDHLHPTRPHLSGRLPGMRVRLFADYRVGPGDSLEAFKLKEVPTRLTTVWFFPNDERMVLIWHGLAEVSEHDGSDIARLMGAVERQGEPREDAHYASVLARRLDPVYGAVESLSDADLLPADVDTVDPAFEQSTEAFKMDGLQAEAQHRRAQIDVAMARERLAAEGKDPDAMGLRVPAREKPPSLAELPAYLKAKRQAMEHQQLLALDDMLQHLEKAMVFAKQHKIDLTQLAHRGPPTYRAREQLLALKDQFAQLGQPFDAAAFALKFVQREKAERFAYMQSAHMQPPAFAQPPAQAAQTRQELAWMLARGLKVLPEIDLTGADLSQLDLRGLDLSGAWLESANLSGSNLSGCNLSGAVLAHADLRGCMLVEAQLVGANLGRARLAGAVLDRADLTGAMLMHTAMAGCHVRHARLVGANLLHTTWGEVDATGADLSGVTFYQLDLRGLCLVEAQLGGAQFIECQAQGLDFSQAQLGGACFVTCELQGARFCGADAVGLVFAKQCELANTDFAQARLSQANFGETAATEARFVSARLDGAYFGMARLDRADFRLVSAKGALFRKARLVGARLAGGQLQDALFPYADLRGTDLRQANLFGADLTRVALDSRTQFDGALTERARTWPRLSPEQQALVATRDLTG